MTMDDNQFSYPSTPQSNAMMPMFPQAIMPSTVPASQINADSQQTYQNYDFNHFQTLQDPFMTFNPFPIYQYQQPRLVNMMPAHDLQHMDDCEPIPKVSQQKLMLPRRSHSTSFETTRSRIVDAQDPFLFPDLGDLGRSVTAAPSLPLQLHTPNISVELAASDTAAESPSQGTDPYSPNDDDDDSTYQGLTCKRPRTNARWSDYEESILVEEAGGSRKKSWSSIARRLPGRTQGAIKKHWYKDMHSTSFCESEKKALELAEKEFDRNKWRHIGEKLKKPPKACQAMAAQILAEKELAESIFGNRMKLDTDAEI